MMERDKDIEGYMMRPLKITESRKLHQAFGNMEDQRAVCSPSSNSSLILTCLVPCGTFLHIRSSLINLHHKTSSISKIRGGGEALD